MSTESEVKQMLKILEIVEKFKIPKIKHIYNVGLGRLEDLTEMIEVFNPLSINAFEPNALNALYDRAKSEIPPRCKIHKVAVCAVDGDIKFHAGKDSTLLQGSIYKPRPDAKCVNVETGEFIPIMVKAVRLDTFIGSGAKPPDLLWIDTQGSEFDVLMGMGKYLKDVPIIHTELYLEQDYEDSKLFDDVDILLDNNFELVDGNPFTGIFDNFIYVNKRFL